MPIYHATRGTSSSSTTSGVPELRVNVKDYGAVGNGSTDDSTAIAAARDALLATRNSSGLPSKPVLYFPPGAYNVVSPDTLLNATTTTNDFVDGMVIQGAGRGISTINFRPAGSTGTLTGRNLMTWKNTSTGGRVVNFRCADITFDCNNSTASFLYSYSETTSYNQHVTFDNVEWSGDWNRVIGLDGSDAAANLNSEISFHNCATWPTTTFADAFFVCAVTPADVSNQQDQMVNYWFRDCLFAWTAGTLLKFPKGGSISVTGGSYSLLGASCLMFHMPFHPHNAGTQRLLVSDIRLELVANGAKTINCEWFGGTIEWINVDESPAAWQTWAPTTKAHRYDWGGNNTFHSGPIVTYRGCTLEGYHEIATGSAALATGRIRYDGCVFFNYTAGQLTTLTGNTGVLRWTGTTAPAYSFRECTGLTGQMPDGGAALVTPTGKGVRVYAASTGQTIATGADAVIDLTTTEFNDDTGLFVVNLTTNSIQVTAAGLLLFTWEVSFTGGGSGERDSYITKGSGTLIRDDINHTIAGEYVRSNSSAIVRAAAGDTFKLNAYIDGGSTVSLSTVSLNETGLSVAYLGA